MKRICLLLSILVLFGACQSYVPDIHSRDVAKIGITVYSYDDWSYDHEPVSVEIQDSVTIEEIISKIHYRRSILQGIECLPTSVLTFYGPGDEIIYWKLFLYYDCHHGTVSEGDTDTGYGVAMDDLSYNYLNELVLQVVNGGAVEK